MSEPNGIHQISNAELQLLKKFIQPQSVLKITNFNYWKKELNEEPQHVIERLLSLGVLEPANQSEVYFSRQYTVAELREMLRIRNLPVSGRKGDLIKRLLASDPEGMMKTASKDLIPHLWITQINRLLKKHGLSIYGTKAERISRVLEVDPEGLERAVIEGQILICSEKGRRVLNAKRTKKENTMKSDRGSNLLLWIAGGVLVIMCFITFLGPQLLTLIPSNITEISILTADTKAEWVETVTEIFNNSEYEISSGKTIHVTVMEQDSPGEAQQAVIDGAIQPTVWSPGDMSWVEAANQVIRDRGNQPLVTGECPRLVYAATGFAMWQPMAEAMGWPDEPIGWDEIVELAADPEGWARYGHPEWEGFKFGHTHPEHSTTGFSMLATLAYAALDSTRGLTPEKVKSEAVLEAFAKVEQNTYHYGTSTRQLMDKMADRGPSYLHAVTASETATLKNNEVKQEKRFPYVFIFPAEGTFWSDNPACIVEADWVSEEQREAAQVYIDYLLAEEQQDVAVTIGLRPANPDVSLHDPISLEFGTDPRVSPQTVPPLEGVSGEVAAAIIDVFKQTKKKATVVVMLDTSGSMREGEKLRNAVQGTISFLKGLARDDEVLVYTFNSSVSGLQPSGRAGDVVETLSQKLTGLQAGGGTALYDSLCQAVSSAESMQSGVTDKQIAARSHAPIFGPAEGSLVHEKDYIGDRDADDVRLDDLLVESIFHNPYLTARGRWDIGFGFRDVGGDNNQFRLSIESNGEWSLFDHRGDNQNRIAGGMLSNLDTSSGGSNHVVLLAQGDNGAFWVNDEFVAGLDLSSRANFGGIWIGSGFIVGNNIPGEATGYENFQVWSIPEDSGEGEIEKRLYGIVVLSDGEDSGGGKTEREMFDCLPTGEDVEGVKVFAIAYGGDANEDLLKRIAERTNGRFFTSDPETIDRVYLAISAEQ